MSEKKLKEGELHSPDLDPRDDFDANGNVSDPAKAKQLAADRDVLLGTPFGGETPVPEMVPALNLDDASSTTQNLAKTDVKPVSKPE